MNLAVRIRGRILRAVHIGLTVEVFVAAAGQRHQADLVAHAELRDHLTGKIGRALDVVGGTRRLDTEDRLLRSAATEQCLELDKKLLLGVEIFLLLRHLHGVTQRAGGVRHDRDLGHRLAVLAQRGDQCVADLMVSHDSLFDVRQDGALLFGTRNDGFKGHQQILLIDHLAAVAHGAQRRLIDQIGKVCADRTGRRLRDLFQVDILCQLDIARMHQKGLVAALQIRAVDHDAAVKTTRTQQRLVQNFRTVRRREDDHALGGIEAVDLGKELIERLLALVVAAELGVAAAADGIDLVDEDDGGSDLGGFLEQVAHAARADADEHLHEVRAGDGEERHVRLARDRLSKQGLAGAGRSDEQRALRQLCADGRVLFRVVQKIDDLL